MRGFFSNVLAGIVGGVMSGIVLAFIAAGLAEQITERALDANPTCASPRGLQPLPRSAIEVLAGSNEPRTSKSASYVPDAAFDGWGGSIWVPELPAEGKGDRRVAFQAGDESVLRVAIKEPQEIRLVCVVNGLANTFSNYQNWGRVRTIRVWGADEADAQTAVLQSLGPDSFPNAQYGARDLGVTDSVSIRLVDAYVGLTVESYDPDICLPDGGKVSGASRVKRGVQARFEQGCVVSATQLAGLSEVYFYVPEDADLPDTQADAAR